MRADALIDPGAGDAEQLDGARRTRLAGALGAETDRTRDHSFGVAVLLDGRLVGETYSHNVAPRTRFDVWSCTKSFTAVAWGLLLAESAADLDTPIYELIDDPEPLSDERKGDVTVRHALSMTTGIPGESVGVRGMAFAPAHGAFEFALGHAPNRFNQWVGELAGEPGAVWDYSDPAFCHLAPAFRATRGREIHEFMQERVFAPLGLHVAWDLQGGGGFRGPHTNAHTGLHMSARDLARFGRVLADGGRWDGRELLPAAWIETAAAPSQPLNPAYGLGLWTNRAGAWIADAPRDTFALAGFAGNRCYVVPSAGVVVARVGTGPHDWDEPRLLLEVLDAVA